MPRVNEFNYGGLIVERGVPTEVKGDVINNDTLETIQEPTVQFKDDKGIDQAVGMSWFTDKSKKEHLAAVIKERYGDKCVPPAVICGIAKELELAEGVNKKAEVMGTKPKEINASLADEFGLEFGNWEGPQEAAQPSDWESPPEEDDDLEDWF